LVKKKVKGKTILELYDLAKDLSEKKNLAQTKPKIVEELDQLLKKHSESIAANLRPPAYSKKPKLILKEVVTLPTLQEYLKK
jgi:hypothetical protein